MGKSQHCRGDHLWGSLGFSDSSEHLRFWDTALKCLHCHQWKDQQSIFPASATTCSHACTVVMCHSNIQCIRFKSIRIVLKMAIVDMGSPVKIVKYMPFVNWIELKFWLDWTANILLEYCVHCVPCWILSCFAEMIFLQRFHCIIKAGTTNTLCHYLPWKCHRVGYH